MLKQKWKNCNRKTSCCICLTLTSWVRLFVINFYSFGVILIIGLFFKSGKPESNAEKSVKLVRDSPNVLKYYFDSTPWEPETFPCELINMTWKYSKRCNYISEKQWNFLITGTGRSGTKGTAQCLRNSGLKVTHDSKGEILEDGMDGSVAWPLLFRKSPFGIKPKHRYFSHIFLQTRDPLMTIPSRATKVHWMYQAAECCIELETHIHRPSSPSAINDSMKYWVTWNSFASILAERQYKVEDRTGSFMNHILKGVISPTRETDFSKCDRVSPTSNHAHASAHNYSTWEQLTALSPEYTQMTKILARKFGYDVDINGQDSFACFVNEIHKWECRLNSGAP